MVETAPGYIAMFNTAEDYHELNAGAHRKPPKVLSAPSLVWHLAFWTNFQEIGRGRAQPINPEWAPNKRPREINKALDGFVRQLWIGLEAKLGRPIDVTPRIDGVHLLFGSAYQQPLANDVKKQLTRRQNDIFASTNRVVSLQFEWQSLDVTIRFETQDEYFTMSVFVELDRLRSGKSTGIGALNETVDRIKAYLNPSRVSPVSAASDGGEPASPSQPADDLIRDINRYSFHEFWRVFDDEVLSLGGAFRNDAIFQRVCADFRGLIASEQTVRFGDDRFFKFNGPPSWGAEAKQMLLPLIQHRIRADHTRYECAVNYMLDGRALYLSTLGPQLTGIADDERIPVEFIVYAHQWVDGRTVVNKWQLGRLVSQILQLGTFRLCALKDVKWLHNAGLELAALEEATQRARRAIARTETYETRAGQNAQENAVERNRTAMNEIAMAHKRLNNITGRFLRKTGSGPLFRIERSRYYVRQFEHNVKLLRILRLEGDQPYDQFIRRRLGPEFDFIDRLGVRYERATASIVSLDQNYLSITQNSLVERATKIDEDTNSIQSEIGGIQRWGEFILLAALVPYYVSHLFVLIKGEPWAVASSAPQLIWCFFILVAVLRIAVQVLKKGLVPVAALLCSAAFALLILFLIELSKPGTHETSNSESSTHSAPKSADQDAGTRDLLQNILDAQREQKQLSSEQLDVLRRLLAPTQPDNAADPKLAPSRLPEPQPSTEPR